MAAAGRQVVRAEGGELLRLDRFLAKRFPEWSRTVLARLIKEGRVLVDGRAAVPRTLVGAGETIAVNLPDPHASLPVPQEIPLAVIYRDEAILVLDKPAGMAAHPVGGRGEGTLVNALLAAYRELPGDARRPGLVHRLDKDTSGVMVVALTARALAVLACQFHERRVEKEYRAVVLGNPAQDEGDLDLPLGRRPHDRRRQQVRSRGGRPARTSFRVLERYVRHAYLAVRPHTGRTHQIRVHLEALGHPVLCDRDYGRGGSVTESTLLGRRRRPAEPSVLDRQFLHAHALAFDHPLTGERVRYTSPLPADLAATLEILRRTRT